MSGGGTGSGCDDRYLRTAARTVDDAVAAVAGGARPVAGGTDLVVGARSGKAALPDGIVAIHRIAELRGDRAARRRRPPARRAREPRGDRRERRRPRALHRARRRLRDRRLARDPRAGHDRRQPDERLAGDGDRRAARLPRRDGDAAVAVAASREVAVEDLWAGPGKTTAAPDELLVAIDVPAPAAGTGSAYLRLEYRRQMEIAVVGATAVVTRRRRHGHRSPDRDDGALADDPARAGGRGGPRRQRRRRRGDRGRRRGGRRGGDADLRRPRLGRLPPRDGGRDRPPRDRRRRSHARPEAEDA